MLRVTVRATGTTLMNAQDNLIPTLRQAGIMPQRIEAITRAPAQPTSQEGAAPEQERTFHFVLHLDLDVVGVTTS